MSERERGLKKWEVVPIFKPEVMADGEGPWIPSPEDIFVVQAEEMRQVQSVIDDEEIISIQFLVAGKPVVIMPLEYVWRAYEQGSLELLSVIREAEDAYADR